MLKYVYIFAISLRLVSYTTAVGLLFVSNHLMHFINEKTKSRCLLQHFQQFYMGQHMYAMLQDLLVLQKKLI